MAPPTLDEILVGVKDKPAGAVRATREVVMAENAARIEAASLEKPQRVNVERMDQIKQPEILNSRQWVNKFHPEVAKQKGIPRWLNDQLRDEYQTYISNQVAINSLRVNVARENRMRFGEAAMPMSPKQQAYREQIELGKGGPKTRAYGAVEAAGRPPAKKDRISRDTAQRLHGTAETAGTPGLAGLVGKLADEKGPEKVKVWVDAYRSWQIGGPGMSRVDSVANQRVLFGPAAVPTLDDTEAAFKAGVIDEVERAIILGAIVDDPTAAEAVRRTKEGKGSAWSPATGKTRRVDQHAIWP